jgi:excisionase family DNA binding protein
MTTHDPTPQQYLTVQQFAEKLQYSPAQIYRWIRKGQIGAIRLSDSGSGPYRISTEEAARFVEKARTRKPVPRQRKLKGLL